MNASSSQLSVEAQLFSKLSLLTTILFAMVGMAFLYVTLAFDSRTTLIPPPNKRRGPCWRGAGDGWHTRFNINVGYYF